jgi:Transposase DDE domain
VHGLDRSLFAAIARDLESNGAVVRKGTSPQSLTAIASLIDGIIIGSAANGDKEAAWVKHRTRAPEHGYKAHIAADKETGIIRDVATTPANEADVKIAPSIIPDQRGEVYADKADDALCVEKAIEAAGGTVRLLRKGHRWLPAKALEAHNRPLRRSGRELRKSSAPGSAAIIFVACDGSGSPRQSAKAILRSSLTTSNASGGCKAPEWTRAKAERKAISSPLEPNPENRQSAKSFAASPSHRSTNDFRAQRPQPASCHLAARFNPSYRLKRRHRTQVSKQFRTIGHRLDATTTRSHSGKQRSFGTA